MQDPIQSIAIIGAGALGRQFALRCAAAGFQVVLEDVMPAKLRHAQQELATLPQTARAVSFALTVEDAVRHADLAVDFVPDELESKLEIFCMIDRMAPPRTAILTPTDALSITDLASCTYRPDRCFAIRGGLESRATTRLVTASQSAPETATRIERFLAAIGLPATTEPDTQPPMLIRSPAQLSIDT